MIAGRPVYAQGEEPAISLANPRTFLAWPRMTLALIATGASSTSSTRRLRDSCPCSGGAPAHPRRDRSLPPSSGRSSRS
ncbi:DUF202 domain-containing protein [Janibacter melonis]|uniref:DUF202 domain-containing protein n=1 Tax=Janibacter melonis TaxID=262209 RepID=UPI0027DA0F95|nr:DUF202 domain-containing protein [Janibacter melonis]